MLLESLQPEKILEIGTAIGFSALLMAKYAPQAQITNEENLTVSAKNASDDMNIEREMWWHMAENLGAGIGENGWNKTRVKNIRFNTIGIYLPKHSECLFKEVKGEISGCEKLKRTISVVSMRLKNILPKTTRTNSTKNGGRGLGLVGHDGLGNSVPVYPACRDSASAAVVLRSCGISSSLC